MHGTPLLSGLILKESLAKHVFCCRPEVSGDLKLLKINRLFKQKFLFTFISKTFARGSIENSKNFQEIKKRGNYHETEKVSNIKGSGVVINGSSAGAFSRKCGRQSCCRRRGPDEKRIRAEDAVYRESVANYG